MANTTWSTTDKANITLSGGNLVATAVSGTPWVRAADKQISGKFYWEITCTTFANSQSGVGISAPAVAVPNFSVVGTAGLLRVGTLTVDSNNAVTGFGTITSGTVVCFAYDATTREIWVRLGAAGNWNMSAANNPATGVGGAASKLGLGIPAYPAFYAGTSGEVVTANFGDSAFTGAVPSGFTSGFTAGVTSSTNALASQTSLEHFFATNPPAQITQTALEMWATTATVTGQALVTQVALEQWVQNPLVSSAQARVMILV